MKLDTFRRFLMAALGLISGALAKGAPAAVTLERTHSTWDAQGYFFSVFRLTNGSAQTIYYDGYGTDEPLRWWQTEQETGWGKEEAGGSCDSVSSKRLGTHFLCSGQSVSFAARPSSEGRNWRLGVKFSRDPAFTRGAPDKVVWSPPMSIMSKEEAERLAAPAPRMEAEILWHPEREHPYTFRLKNRSGETLYYGSCHEPRIAPVYLMQVRKADGWRDDGFDCLGTRLAFRPLHPDEVIEFSIPMNRGPSSKDEDWRIGLRFFRSSAPSRLEEACQPIWWRQLPPRGTAPNFAAK